MATIPPLQLAGGTAGPATGQAQSDVVSTIGDLVFKGSSTRDNSTNWMQTLAPVLIAGAALWLIAKR